MKRIKAACIFQTLIFSQKPELMLSKEKALELNRDEIARYKAGLEQTKTRHKIVSQEEQADGSIIMRVRKQYSYTTEVSEYFE